MKQMRLQICCQLISKNVNFNPTKHNKIHKI